MTNKNVSPRYFIAANTPMGFFSYIDHFVNKDNVSEVYVIKGGPGTGKSSFMKTIAAKCLQQGLSVEFIYCSSDPISLDGVFIKEPGILILDGTAPHTLDPLNPGVNGKIINLGEFWDEKGIKTNSKRIISLCGDIFKSYTTIYNILSTISNFTLIQKSITHPLLLTDKMNNAIQRLVECELPKKPSEQIGKSDYCFLTALSEYGITGFFDSIKAQYKNIITVSDDYEVSGNLLSEIAKIAIMRGYDIIIGNCPLNPKEKIEHILIPELDLAFITVNLYHSITCDYYKNINMKRFIDIDKISEHKNMLKFCKNNIEALLQQISEIMRNIHIKHDELEMCYNPYVNFDKVYALANDVADDICAK